VSGIAGILRFDEQLVSSAQIKSMLDKMPYRGPDGMSCWAEGVAALGHAMLYTTPESLDETQPLRVPELDLTLVMDGRVDNSLELRGRLLASGVAIAGNSDADLVIAAYILWGNRMPEQLEGDFALAIWDGRSGQLFCARDRVGFKPFYYYHGPELFAFASELHILLDLPEVGRKEDKTYLAEHMAQRWYSRERTPWSDIKRLVAACSLRVGRGELVVGEYWRPDYQHSLYYPRYEDYVEHYRELFDDTVRRMSRSHKTLACEVSGGLDSSSIFATAAALEKRGSLLAPGAEAYTIDFSGHPDAEEIAYARMVAGHTGYPLQEVSPRFYPLSWYLERGGFRREVDMQPNGAVSNTLLSEVNARGQSVLLDGSGGDQWLAFGRGCYLEALSRREWRELAALWRRDREAMGARVALYGLLRHGALSGLPPRFKWQLRSLVERLQGVLDESQWLSAGQSRRLQDSYRRYLRSLPTDLRWSGQFSEWQRLHCPDVSSVLEMKEQLAAEAGIERRSPLWSVPMIEFSLAVPKRMLYAPELDRPLHRQAMAGRLPQGVLERADKAGFSVTFQRIMPEVREWLSGRVPEAQQLGLKERVVRQVLHGGHTEPMGETRWSLWLLMCAVAAYKTHPG
jgi:asparagine synthase (glutamine-hydrolysing)